MSDTILWGAKIHLQEFVAQDTAIGLYSDDEDMTGNAAAAQADIDVVDGDVFDPGDTVIVSDDNSTEIGVIDSISTDKLTLKADLQNAYTTAANGKVQASRFRWIETTLAGTRNTWKAGMLQANAFEPIKESANLERGGGVTKIDSTSVRIKDTSQFYDSLDDADIGLNGLRMDIMEFIDTGSVSENIIYYGSAAADTWDVKTYVIPIENAFSVRNAPMGRRINETDNPDASADLIGVMTPMTFGDIYQSGEYSKFQRIANAQTTFENLTDQQLDVGDNTTLEVTGDSAGIKVYPIVGDDGNTPPLMYKIQIAAPGSSDITWKKAGVVQTSGQLGLDVLEDQYIKVIEGTGVNTFRKIDAAQVDLDTDDRILELTLSDYFKEDLVGNSTATEDDQSWVSIVDIARQYQVDVWPMKDYLDEDGDPISNGLNLFAYSDQKKANVTVSGAAETVLSPVEEQPFKYLRLPQYAYEDDGGGNKNIIDIDVKLFNNNPDNMDSFLVKPVTGFTEYIKDDLGEFDISTEDVWVNYKKVIDGFYRNGRNPQATTTPTDTLPNVTDKDDATSYKLRADMRTLGSTNLKVAMCFTCSLPEISDNFDFDDVYMGILMRSLSFIDSQSDGSYHIRYRRFMGDAKEALSVATSYKDITDGEVKCLPDFYFDHDNNNNLYFYYENTVTNNTDQIFGYNRFEFPGVTNKDLYDSIKEVGLFTWVEGVLNNAPGILADYHECEYYEAAVIFRKSVSIKDAVYCPSQGRIFDDTWGGGRGKVAANLMEDPVDILEHICRVQNWTETGDKSVTSGKAYSDSALINTGTDQGGFDATSLNSPRASAFAFQVFDYNKSYTDVMKRKICRAAWLLSYVNEDGEESVEYLPKNITPSDTITFGDVPEGMEIGNVREAKMQNVYCEPFVRYRWDSGPKTFNAEIRITNTHKDTFDASYVTGATGTAAETLWDKAKTLWDKYHFLKDPPSDMTDRDEIRNPTDAYSYLSNWLEWMGLRRISVPVDYATAKTWHVGRHIYLNLPHQTDGSNKECIIEGISKYKGDRKQNGVCILDLIILDTFVGDNRIIDTMTTAAGGADADWVDSMTAQGGDDDKIDTI